MYPLQKFFTMIDNLVKQGEMKLSFNKRSYFVLALSLLSLSSCLKMNNSSEDSVRALMAVKAQDATPDELLGIWEARYQVSPSSSSSEIWRMKVYEDKIYFAVRCTDGSIQNLTGSNVNVKLADEENRVRIDFEQTVDFRVRKLSQNNEATSQTANLELCGAAVLKGSTTYAYLDQYQLKMRPFLEELNFEKIADLSDKDKNNK